MEYLLLIQFSFSALLLEPQEAPTWGYVTQSQSRNNTVTNYSILYGVSWESDSMDELQRSVVRYSYNFHDLMHDRSSGQYSVFISIWYQACINNRGY